MKLINDKWWRTSFWKLEISISIRGRTILFLPGRFLAINRNGKMFCYCTTFLHFKPKIPESPKKGKNMFEFGSKNQLHPAPFTRIEYIDTTIHIQDYKLIRLYWSQCVSRQTLKRKLLNLRFTIRYYGSQFGCTVYVFYGLVSKPGYLLSGSIPQS